MRKSLPSSDQEFCSAMSSVLLPNQRTSPPSDKKDFVFNSFDLTTTGWKCVKNCFPRAHRLNLLSFSLLFLIPLMSMHSLFLMLLHIKNTLYFLTLCYVWRTQPSIDRTSEARSDLNVRHFVCSCRLFVIKFGMNVLGIKVGGRRSISKDFLFPSCFEIATILWVVFAVTALTSTLTFSIHLDSLDIFINPYNC